MEYSQIMLKEVFPNNDLYQLNLSKSFLMDNYIPPRPIPEHKNTTRANSKTQRKLFDLTNTVMNFYDYLPLYELWKQYVTDLCGGNFSRLGSILLRADLHGAYIAVHKAKCHTYQGMSGIILQESRHTFKIVTPNNTIKTLLKKDSSFLIKIGDVVVELYGQHFLFKPSQRTKERFREKDKVNMF